MQKARSQLEDPHKLDLLCRAWNNIIFKAEAYCSSLSEREQKLLVLFSKWSLSWQTVIHSINIDSFPNLQLVFQ